MGKIIAVIDLGSNSLRMSINSLLEDGSFKLLKKVRETVRLSENMSKNGCLNEASIKRVIFTLKEFCKIIEEYNGTVVRAITTAAVRYASNKDEFLSRVKEETGIEFRVISGEEEAYYSFLAVKSTLGIDNGVIMDTGGGSTEFSLIKNGELINSISLPLGAVVLTEKTAHLSQIELYKYVSSSIGNIEWIAQCESLPVYAIGGSARTAGMIYKEKIIKASEIDGIELPYNSFANLYQEIFNTSPEKRKNIDGMDVSRADIILAGLTPLKAFMDMTGSKNIRICLCGVKEGVFFEIKNEIIAKGGI